MTTTPPQPAAETRARSNPPAIRGRESRAWARRGFRSPNTIAGRIPPVPHSHMVGSVRLANVVRVPLVLTLRKRDATQSLRRLDLI
jgi:hypothetical protein